MGGRREEKGLDVLILNITSTKNASSTCSNMWNGCHVTLLLSSCNPLIVESMFSIILSLRGSLESVVVAVLEIMLTGFRPSSPPLLVTAAAIGHRVSAVVAFRSSTTTNTSVGRFQSDQALEICLSSRNQATEYSSFFSVERR